ncbi:MAG: hypothetical protein J5829_04310 [Lachnospiraceae bacterium]|nr:hypothetical protein [Lachnospiraceae bacterium]
MACFLVSAAEAVVVTAIEKNVEKKETHHDDTKETKEIKETKIPLSRKLKWLTYMLWGGVALLAFEHVWHGEITPFFPFLTAMNDPEETSVMLTEMATVGTSMAVLITGVWAGICAAADSIVKRPEKTPSKEEAAS